MSTVAERKPPQILQTPEDTYYYGFRDEHVLQPDGSYKHQRIVLTLEDHLHPHEGDQFMEGSLHDLLRMFLRAVFGTRVEHDPESLVLSDTPIYWDDPELGNHGPDVAVIFGVKRPRREWKSFHVEKEGARPRVMVELVTPRYRKNDVVDKMQEYHQARVPIYIIFDRERDDDPWTLKPYRWNPDRYVLQPVEENGRYWLEDLNLWLAADGHHIRCFDGETGEEIGDYSSVTRRLQQMQTLAASEKARADSAEARARDLEAELARLKGQTPAS